MTSELVQERIPVRGGTRCRVAASVEHPDVVVRCRRERHHPKDGHVGCDGHWWLAWGEDGDFSMRAVGLYERIPVRWTPQAVKRATAPYDELELPWFLRNSAEGQ